MTEQVLLNLTPDPKVLIALTHTHIQPLDALCELIDNAIDSFSSAKLQGVQIDNPVVRIDLPKPPPFAGRSYGIYKTGSPPRTKKNMLGRHGDLPSFF